MRQKLAPALLAATTALAACGGPETAQTPALDEFESTSGAEATARPIIEFATQGGFILYSIDLKVFSNHSVVASKRFVRNGHEVLSYSATLTAAEYRALVAAIPSNFSRLPAAVHSERFI